jgi:hypothetical protein
MWSITPCCILSEVSHAFGVSSSVSHLLLILISYVTLFHLLLPCSNFGNWDQPLYPERDLGNDWEEGVTVEINKCAECDSDDEKVP